MANYFQQGYWFLPILLKFNETNYIQKYTKLIVTHVAQCLTSRLTLLSQPKNKFSFSLEFWHDKFQPYILYLSGAYEINDSK